MFKRPILVTDGAGFAGPHLTDALLTHGYRVRVSDNLSAGKCDNLPLDDERVELLEGDVANAAILTAALKGCAAVARLAAVASVQASVDDPVATHQGNFIATLNLYKTIREQDVKRMVFAPNAAVYGQSGEGTAIDGGAPKSPLTPCTSDRLASEYYLDFYHRQHGPGPAVFHFLNVYRPYQDPSSPYSGVINIFAECALKGTLIIMLGDGKQARDFIYVTDPADFLVQTLEATTVEPEAVNVDLNRSINLKQLLMETDQVLGGPPPVVHADTRTGGIKHSRMNNGRPLRRFRFDQPTSVGVGLARLLDR